VKDAQKFISEAKSGVVTVVFKKINTEEIRVMPCTLNSDVAGKDIVIKDFDALSDNLVVWCLDKDAYRSFRVNTVIKWYTGYPEGYEL